MDVLLESPEGWTNLRELGGVGPSTERIIKEILDTGSSRSYERLLVGGNLSGQPLMENVRRNIILSANLDKDLEEASRMLGEKKSAIIRNALVYYFDYLDLSIAKERAAKYEAGVHKGLTAEEVKKALDL
ncbi:MAG: hypothetical protein DRZ90_08020 [Spirochaetes bacterium]|nr:MAG: hypothetical protein DRZ90_08020 [Spirochaetota bacterium]